VTLPHLILIDDSEAILAFEQAVLSTHYTVTTATDGADGLVKVRALRPAGVLLDLSMPGMPGEEVLREILADSTLRDTPVVIVSSEKARGEACLGLGAAGFLAKPIRAEDLVAIVGRALESAKRKLAREGMAILVLGAGPLELGIQLDIVRLVTWQPQTYQLPAGPSYLCEFFELYGDAICVLDLPRRLGVEHTTSIAERKLVVIEQHGMKMALCVDRVWDPEEIVATDITRVADASQVEGVRAVVRTSRGPTPVVDPHLLLSRGMLLQLTQLMQDLASEAKAP
jgi:CheY-like chemotaxis protein/chemotaxis signal transduction protein